ncbi:amino acid racemase [Streptococcus sp. zg-86]|uniref:Amino acid racemase n=1 Tax=Streptococcus zhangguiae TaxID=2664091 RepID=A0A6I4RJ12_9STRE|nr:MULTISPECIES: amino acid racemase [unclassified Streptococcus]MTB64710.1 amino acid racemase [Streptococcus sp. zg-86]MTB91542.1 amino acid racemase [Streptococcus sp. zg-36]MWV56787.1 amino acid racemase [Streptococcus sp. zg-70]QTH48518.1 aspartate/glutamate racemase family protein [Streptococcus sp. zg-86]
MNQLTIGVLGGMGTYATIHFFEQYAHVFNAEKEWERPRIIIDNRCTMPSRVRAFLYGERREQLVEEMIESIENLVKSGATKVVLACNTSHLFIPEIMTRIPQYIDSIVNIIEVCAKKVIDDQIKEVFLIGSEGTIESRIYQNILESQGIRCVVPQKEQYTNLRKCIESVKQNEYSDEIREIFLSLINEHTACILGCTELPILYEKYSAGVNCEYIYDPLFLVLNQLKEEFINEKNINIRSI